MKSIFFSGAPQMAMLLGAALLGLCAAAPAQAANHTGSYVFNVAITLKTAIPASQKIWCHVSLYRFQGSGTSFTTDATVVATRNGAKATCAPRVYFSWPNTDYYPTQSITISSYGPKDAATGLQQGKQQLIAVANNVTPPEGGSATINVSTEF